MSMEFISPEIVISDVRAEEEVSRATSAGVHDNSGGGQEYPPHASGSDRDLWLYRDRTVALLRRYGRMSVEVGRLPSVLGRECFQARVTPYAMTSFEDMAIFVHDIGTALKRLDDSQQQLIALNVLEEFSQWEIAHMLGCTTRWIEWQVPDAIDRVSEILLQGGLLTRMPEPETGTETCQEGEKADFTVSDSKDGENIF